MRIEIDREQPGMWRQGECVFFEATDSGAAKVTVKLDVSAWDTIQSEWSYDPLAGVEALARHGHWRMFDDKLVWRVDLV